MKIYQITSDTTKIPLAEIRTDGNAVHFIVDNTDGMLPADVKNSFERLKQIVKTSHHLKIQEPELPTTNLLRYVLSDGNVVEITTDGKTCMLNGKIIDDKQKEELFHAIRAGKLHVSARPSTPIPVLPSPKRSAPPAKADFSPGVIRALNESAKKQEKIKSNYDENWDPTIEKTDFSYSDDPKSCKSFMYYLKYGKMRRYD